MQFNKPTCEFREKRLLLGTLPLNLTTVKTVHIENKGNCHAYFKVNLIIDTCISRLWFPVLCALGKHNNIVMYATSGGSNIVCMKYMWMRVFSCKLMNTSLVAAYLNNIHVPYSWKY